MKYKKATGSTETANSPTDFFISMAKSHLFQGANLQNQYLCFKLYKSQTAKAY
jgi:hypothetical protein